MPDLTHETERLFAATFGTPKPALTPDEIRATWDGSLMSLARMVRADGRGCPAVRDEADELASDLERMAKECRG